MDKPEKVSLGALERHGGSLDDLDYLRHESQQAWEHYRHLESVRTQSLSFFFTVCLATSGFMLSLLSGGNAPSTGWLLTGVAVLGLILMLLSFLLYASVQKIGQVLRHYADVVRTVRDRFIIDADPITAQTLEGLNVWDRLSPLMSAKLYSVQGIAQWILGGAAWLFALCQPTVLAAGIWASQFSPTQLSIVALTNCITLTFASVVASTHRQARRHLDDEVVGGGG